MWVAQHISCLCSNSVRTFVSVAGVNVATSTRIYPLSSDKVVGSGGTQTASFMYLQKKKKSSGVKSGEEGGQVIGLCVLINFPQKLLIQKVSNCNVKMWSYSVLAE